MTNPLPTSDLTSNFTLSDQVTAFYNELDVSKLSQLRSIYHDNIEFSDPVTSHRGLGQLTGYFERLLSGCTFCRFDINNLTIGPADGWISWTMFFIHPRLNAGKTIKVDGMSILHIENNKIRYQQDFYDMGAMIYEQIPLLGSIIKFLRRRIA